MAPGIVNVTSGQEISLILPMLSLRYLQTTKWKGKVAVDYMSGIQGRIGQEV